MENIGNGMGWNGLGWEWDGMGMIGGRGKPINLTVASSSMETHFFRGTSGGLEVLGRPEV